MVMVSALPPPLVIVIVVDINVILVYLAAALLHSWLSECVYFYAKNS